MRKFIIPLFLGILAAFAALVAEQVITLFYAQEYAEGIFKNPSWLILAVTVLAEETLKCAVIFRHIFPLKDRKEIYISALMVGLGFSLTEIGFIFLKHYPWGFFQIISVLGVLVIHTLTAGLAGLLFPLLNAKNTKIRMIYVVLLTFILHFTYNIFVLFQLGYFF